MPVGENGQPVEASRPLRLVAALVATGGLAVLSVGGAFVGSGRAGEIFNSLPLAGFWIALAAALALEVAVNIRPIRSPGRLMTHLGCLLVLVGAMTGSELAQKLSGKLLGSTGPRGGMVLLSPGRQSRTLYDKSLHAVGELPFVLRLRRSQIEYYEPEPPWRLFLYPFNGEGSGAVELNWKIGQEIAISDTDIRVTVLEYVPRARAVPGSGPTSAPAPAGPDEPLSAPAMRVLVRYRDRGGEAWLTGDAAGRAAVLPLGPLTGQGPGAGPGLLRLEPARQTKDCRSEIVVLKQGTPVVEAVVRVNQPLHYDGYHVNLVSIAPGGETILVVKSDTGLYVVYAGLALLCLGMFWTCWGSLVRDRLSRGEGGA